MEQFDHEKLDVYQHSVVFVAWANDLVGNLTGKHRNVRDQLIRSSQSIPLNIAEGNGKRTMPERRRFFEIARASALESAAALDVMVATKAKPGEAIVEGKKMLLPIVRMLVRLAPPDGHDAMIRSRNQD